MLSEAQKVLKELSLMEAVSKMTLDALIQSTKKQVKSQNTFVGRVAIVKTTPMVGTKTITFFAQASGTRPYSMIMRFSGVKFSKELDKDHTVTVNMGAGQTVFMSKLSLTNNPVQVRCDDPSYKFTFGFANQKIKALAGKAFTPYTKKTDRPYKNPGNVPGLCKHLVAFVERLKMDGFLRN